MNHNAAEILAAQEHFGFARPAPIEKDWHILRAMGAIASIEAEYADGYVALTTPENGEMQHAAR